MDREYYEWDNFWWEKAGDRKCSRVAIVGDSITCGYRDEVQKMLKDREILVDRFSCSRCAGDPALNAELEYVFGAACGYEYKVIHFNNGLHGGCNDTMISDEEYNTGIEECIKIIKKLQPGAQIIIATSTNMVDMSKPEDEFDGQKNAFIIRRNDFVKKFAAENNIPVDDLYEAVAWKAEYPHSDGVHFKPESYRKLAECVVESMLPYLK
ncbi:MAG: SGNH/GDSL hydrolase family protein [Firmicutes bacterium]|nr:SGNH/GDSL hydrolase family protein [Bacillota bacterium]